MRDKQGRFLPTKHNTQHLRKVVGELMDQGKTPTEIAKILMMDHDVGLYYSVRLIQEAKAAR